MDFGDDTLPLLPAACALLRPSEGVRHSGERKKKLVRADYYEILGVTMAATGAEIKSAYRRLAMENHPDRNNGDPDAEEKCKAINQAYDILGDEQKKRHYDLNKFRLVQGNGSHDPVADLFGGLRHRNPFGGCGGFGFKGMGCRRRFRKF